MVFGDLLDKAEPKTRAPHYTQKSKPGHVSAIVGAQMESHATWKRADVTSRRQPLEQSMASKRTIGLTAVLVVIGSIQIAVVIFDGACGTPGTNQWLIILIFRRDGRVVDVWSGKERMAEMKLSPVRFEFARRVGVQP